ncbi:hypothetical protein [Candidatus Poriferisodalis sp.]|uniref:hypothetical protein n=1 Tax=Candidatus Poriferisodalis sp. TaxID=3101277 RepID=UPI003B02BE2A
MISSDSSMFGKGVVRRLDRLLMDATLADTDTSVSDSLSGGSSPSGESSLVVAYLRIARSILAYIPGALVSTDSTAHPFDATVDSSSFKITVLVEGGAAVTVEAVIPEAPTTAVTVPLSVSYGGGATAEDHSAIPASVTFDVAATKATFTVSAANDSDDDDGESVTISFGAPPSGHTAAGSTTVSFVDNDGPVLVGNTGQYEKSAEALVDHDHAQRFTTGSNTDGYSLTTALPGCSMMLQIRGTPVGGL